MHLAVPVSSADPIRGNPSAPTTLLEYGDYQCPYCARAHEVVTKLLRLMPDDVRFVFRHFPLTELHPRALASALAVEAAGVQGELWSMHDMLFEHQDALEDYDLVAYANTLGLNVARFAQDFASDRAIGKVNADMRSGARSGVQGTPSFFIDGTRWEGSWDLDSLVEALGAHGHAART